MLLVGKKVIILNRANTYYIETNLTSYSYVVNNNYLYLNNSQLINPFMNVQDTVPQKFKRRKKREKKKVK